MTVSAQMDDNFHSPSTDLPPTGPVGQVDDGTQDNTDLEDQLPEWHDLASYTGPLGQVDEYLPHDACDQCFTLPQYDKYAIYEYAPSDIDDGALIISREIPNPAPVVKTWDDYNPKIGGYEDPETSEEVWFIGTQGFVGPTDEEKWSPDLPVSTIAMKRIKARHLDEIMGIEGVTSFGIGTQGFVVDLLSNDPLHVDRVPNTLEGVPVDVRLTDSFAVLSDHSSARLRPLPAGGSVGVNATSYGTLGPHAVRDTDTASNRACCQMLSLTAAHVVNPTHSSTAWRNRTVYSPGASTAATNRIGVVDYSFAPWSCGKLGHHPERPLSDPTRWITPSTCSGTTGTNVNHANTRPDIALISYGWRSVPFNTPERDSPIRRMQYGATKSVRGPSGRIKTAEKGDKHKVWGARTAAAGTGKVKRVDV